MPSLTWGIFETIFATSYNNSKRYLTLSPRWTGHNTDLPSDSNISKAVRVNIAFAEDFCKEYSSFLMVCRLIDFALVVLMLLMFKVCVIIGISKIEFFNFSGTERVKQNKKNLKTIQNLLSLEVNYFSSNFNKFPICFWFFTETLSLSLPVPRWEGHNSDLPSDSNISKTVRVNITFAEYFLKNIQQALWWYLGW